MGVNRDKAHWFRQLMKHENNGACEKCALIFDRYPGFYPQLRHWFEKFQFDVPSAHISCAGRGKLDQEALLVRGATKAAWGRSAHNYGAAIDVFELDNDRSNIYEREWFEKNLKPRLEPWLTWYGTEGSIFFELPHVQLENWRALVARGELFLVE